MSTTNDATLFMIMVFTVDTRQENYMTSSARPRKTALLVAERIVADIHERGNVEGDKLPPERVMLETYDVGRGTLRESLRFLELQGVLTLKPGPNGGPIVQIPDGSSLTTSLSLLLQFHKTSFETIIETRVALEPGMARQAAERMSDEDIEELREVLAGERAAHGDQAKFLRQTRRFHTLIARGSGNIIFSMLFEALVDILDGAALGVVYSERQRGATIDVHAQIVDAIANHDPDVAEAAMATQMQALKGFLEKRHTTALSSPVVWQS